MNSCILRTAVACHPEPYSAKDLAWRSRVDPSPSTAQDDKPCDGRQSAFTLTELIVVLGLIVVLAGFALPMIMRAYKAGERSRTAADLQTLALALDAYRADFGEYPRVNPVDATGTPILNTGAAVLCKALIGPGPARDPAPLYDAATAYLPGQNVLQGTSEYVCVQAVTGVAPPNATYWVGPVTEASPAYSGATSYLPGQTVVSSNVVYLCIAPSRGNLPPNANFWAAFSPGDGSRGPGLRIRPQAARVYGPYVQPDRFKFRGMYILDKFGNPILYFPAPSSRPNINVALGFVASSEFSLYDARDNLINFRLASETDDTNSIKRVRAMLGDMNNDGMITAASETPASTGSFLLWSAGPDRTFGPAVTTPAKRDVEKCDDVTNFR